MGACTPAALRKQITAGQLDGVYLLLGDDPHEKRELAAAFEEVVEAELRPFNVERFQGGDVALGAVLDTVHTVPMMAPRRIVITFHAERMLQPKRESQATTRDLEALEAYLKRPVPTATLVLVADRLDERRRTIKHLLSRATVVRCGTLDDVNAADRWIRARLKAAGVEAEPAAIRQLAGIVGPDLGRLRGEVDRLLLYAAGQDRITAADLRQVVGPSAAHNNWAVARAIERGATDQALRELALVLEAGAVPYMVLGQLAWVARTKLAGSRAGPAIEAVFRTDVALKRSAGEPRVLLERLVAQLCAGGGDGPGSRR